MPNLKIFLHHFLRYPPGLHFNNDVFIFDLQIMFSHQLVQLDARQENAEYLIKVTKRCIT